MEQSKVTNFYNDAVVLITGGTGFLGKILIEKLLRCTLVAKIFILVRCKKNKNESERYNEIFEQKLFDSLKEEQPDFIRRVELITGDCVLPDLGIDEVNWQRLKDKVSVVFHCAATVRFDQKLKTAAYINVRATADLVRHAKNMNNLKAFIHVSTAFSNCPRKDIDEVFYEPGLTANKLFGLFHHLTDKQIEACTSSLIGEWPNTYVFTKCISEDVLKTDAIGLPVAVLRPSIVTSTYKEPAAGWIDNFYGHVGVTCAATLGVLRTINVHPEKFADIVPADYFINLMLTSAWKVSEKKNEEKSRIDIYNYVSIPEAPVSWSDLLIWCKKYAESCPLRMMVWKPVLYLNRSAWVNKIFVVLLHWTPAYIIDFFCSLLGKPAVMVENYTKLHKFLDVIQYFMNREWIIGNRNTQELWNTLNEKDRTIFHFSMANLDWSEYCKTFVLGARLYLLKDPVDTIPAAKRKFFIFKCLHFVLMFVVYSCAFWFLYTCWRILLG